MGHACKNGKYDVTATVKKVKREHVSPAGGNLHGSPLIIAKRAVAAVHCGLLWLQ